MNTRKRTRLGIGWKILSVIWFTIVIIVIFSGIIGYFWGYKLMRNTVTENHMQMAEVLALSMANSIENEIKSFEAVLRDPIFQNYTILANQKYQGMSDVDITAQIDGIESIWQDSTIDSPVLEKIFNNDVSYKLKEFVEDHDNIAEAFITDIKGVVLGASNKTTDYYQAD
ncbi:MAG: hypothetical protein ABIB11_05955, partial [Candidatus Omnitrophota bacterium]